MNQNETIPLKIERQESNQSIKKVVSSYLNSLDSIVGVWIEPLFGSHYLYTKRQNLKFFWLFNPNLPIEKVIDTINQDLFMHITEEQELLSEAKIFFEKGYHHILKVDHREYLLKICSIFEKSENEKTYPTYFKDEHPVLLKLNVKKWGEQSYEKGTMITYSDKVDHKVCFWRIIHGQ